MSREEQLRIQALGAALSRRDWDATERAYDAIRDEFDRRPQSLADAPAALTPISTDRDRWAVQGFDPEERGVAIIEERAGIPPGGTPTNGIQAWVPLWPSEWEDDDRAAYPDRALRVAARICDAVNAAPPARSAASIEQYLIWSHEHGCWWRPNSAGYTSDPRAAGIYSRDEALSISWRGRDGWDNKRHRPDEIAVPIDVVPEALRPTIARNDRGSEAP